MAAPAAPASGGHQHATASAACRRHQYVGRQDLRLVHRHPDVCHLLRSVLALSAASPDKLGLRRQLHPLRHAVHDGRGLRPLPQRPCPRRLPLSQLAAARAGGDGPAVVRPLLLSGNAGVRLRRLGLRRPLPGRERALGLQPGRSAHLSLQDADPRHRHPHADARRGRVRALRRLPADRRLAAASPRCRRAGEGHPGGAAAQARGGVMTDPQLGVLMLALFVVFILLGFPIAFTLMALGVFFGYLAYHDLNPVFQLLVQRTYSVMSNDVLISVPLFVFMGYVIERANILDRLFRSIQLAAGGLPASLAIATLATCALFATATGIVGAVVTLMGLLAYPAMLRQGYDARLSAGVVCAGGCLGILIPPSVMLILYGATAGVSVVKLYAGAFLPGFMLAGLYMLYVVARALIN